MNAMRIIADEPTQVPSAALAIYRSMAPLCVCFGNGSISNAESLHQRLVAFQPLVEALNMVKAKFYAEGTFDAAGRLLVPLTVDDFAEVCWALSQVEIEVMDD